MVDSITLDLIDKHLVTNALTLDVGYDRENVSKGMYRGPLVIDRYGREIPKPAHGTANMGHYTSSQSQIAQAVLELCFTSSRKEPL